MSGDGGGVSSAGMRGVAGEQFPGVLIFTFTRARTRARLRRPTVAGEAGERLGSLRSRRPRPVPRRSAPVPIGLLPVHRTRAPGRASLTGGESSADLAGEERRSRWRARPHGASAVARSVISTNTKTWRSRNHVSRGSGFCGDLVGTDASAHQTRPGRRIPPRNVETCPGTAGAPPPPACEPSLASSFQASSFHPYKGAERARTVSVTPEEKLGSFSKAQVRTGSGPVQRGAP